MLEVVTAGLSQVDAEQVAMGKHDIPGRFEEDCSSVPDQADEPSPEEASDADDECSDDDGPAPRQNSYRDEDWEEDPPRIRAKLEDVEPRRRFVLDGASDDEIRAAHAEMLAVLSSEAFDFAMDCFETARGIDDRVAGRSRKLAMACRLAGLVGQLVGVADKHRIAL